MTSAPSERFALRLLGPFELTTPDRNRIDISSKKGTAVIATAAPQGATAPKPKSGGIIRYPEEKNPDTLDTMPGWSRQTMSTE
mgnify:CR=1 FL=1